MTPYPKIETVFKRDPDNKFKTLLDGQFAEAEFAYLASNDWVFTEKVDGTNIRVMWDGAALTFGGKSDKAQIPPKLMFALGGRFGDQLGTFSDLWPDGGVCLYGEGFGAGIQKGGGNYRPDADFVLFDVKVGDWWLRQEDVDEVATYFASAIVPCIGGGTLLEMVEMVREGFQSEWGDFTAEGIVARPATELCTRGGKRIITKIKHKDFVVVQEGARPSEQ